MKRDPRRSASSLVALLGAASTTARRSRSTAICACPTDDCTFSGGRATSSSAPGVIDVASSADYQPGRPVTTSARSSRSQPARGQRRRATSSGSTRTTLTSTRGVRGRVRPAPALPRASTTSATCTLARRARPSRRRGRADLPWRRSAPLDARRSPRGDACRGRSCAAISAAGLRSTTACSFETGECPGRREGLQSAACRPRPATCPARTRVRSQRTRSASRALASDCAAPPLTRRVPASNLDARSAGGLSTTPPARLRPE